MSKLQVIRRENYRRPDYMLDRVELTFDLAPEDTRVEAVLALRREGPKGAPLKLDGEDLALESLALDGRDLAAEDYELTETGLIIADLPDSCELRIVTRLSPAQNKQLMGLYTSDGTYCTQCEAEGFRRITFFPDRPDVMAIYTVTIRAPKSLPVLLSNGNLIESGDLPDGRHFARWHDPFAKPSYLFALVAGDLACVQDEFTTKSGRKVALRIWVEHGNEDRCGWAMDSLKRSMRWDEERFGLEYDLDQFNIVAVSAFNFGAMENKSLNIFNDKYILADSETATDSDYLNIEGIVAHEYLHNWSGNRVTCRDWFQLSLKEGLTVFRDREFTSDCRSRPVRRIQTVRDLRSSQFPEDAGPLKHPVRPESYINIDNFYTRTVYEKGAEVVGMIATILGRDGFAKALRLYFERHDGEAATCEDFVKAMEDASGEDLSQFRLWYSQPGTPEVTVTTRYDAAARRFTVTASQNMPQAMDIPLASGLLDQAGNEIIPERLLRLTEKQQDFVFDDIAQEPVLSINRGFSAPVNIKMAQPDERLSFLMARDNDPFNRWDSGQTLAMRLLLKTIADVQAGHAAEPDTVFTDALAESLDRPDLDREFAAQTLMLPGEALIAEQMEVIDVDAIHQASDMLRRTIGRRLHGQLLNLYHNNQSNEPYSPDPASAGRRALKNIALRHLTALSDPVVDDLLMAQFRQANNMTDRLAALSMLTETSTTASDQALAEFYKRFRSYPTVIDKWFAVQASAPVPDALDITRDLMGHEAFTLENPNRALSLLGSFARSNPTAFHAADGSGYRFIADQVIALDDINPRTAKPLLTNFQRIRRFDPARQSLMEAELRRILAKPKLSTDCYELVTLTLGES